MNDIFKKYWLPVLTVILIVLIIVGGYWAYQRFNEQYRVGQLQDYVFRAQQATEEGDYITAFDLYNQARAIDSEDMDIVKQQADVAFLNGDFDLAGRLYIMAGVNESSELTFIESLISLKELQIDTAIAVISDLNVSEKDILTEKRFDSYKETLSKTKEESNPLLRKAKIGELLLNEHAYVYAQTVLEQLVKDEPLYHDALYLLGVAYANQGMLENAITSLEDALKIMPTYEPASTLLKELNP